MWGHTQENIMLNITIVCQKQDHPDFYHHQDGFDGAYLHECRLSEKRLWRHFLASKCKLMVADQDKKLSLEPKMEPNLVVHS